MAGEKSTTLLTSSQQIRLESVQLAYRHDRSPEDVIKRASELADYVEGKQAATRKRAANGEQVGPETDLI